MRKDCKICKTAGTAGLLESFGVVFTALEAHFNGDLELLNDLHDMVQPVDFHAALSVLVTCLHDLTAMGLNVPKWLDANRKLINEQIAALGREAPGGESPNGPDGPGDS